MYSTNLKDLYLNEANSDVIFEVQGTLLHAHRLILSQQCNYFVNKFADSEKVQYTYSNHSLAAFKLVLQPFYGIKIMLNGESTDVIIDLICLADKFNLPDLVKKAVDKIKADRIQLDTIWVILNKSLQLSHNKTEKLTKLCSDFLERNAISVFAHDSFTELSLESVQHVLKLRLCAPEANIFDAMIRWMHANLHKKIHFSELVRLIDLNLLEKDDLLLLVRTNQNFDMTGQLITDKQFIDIWHGQPDEIKTTQTCPIRKVATELDGAVLVDGAGSLLSEGKFHSLDLLKHRVNGTSGIVIDLKRQCLLNCLKMKLAGNRSYTIFVSSDRAKWTRIIDRSNYSCHGIQELYFNDCNVRCIRIEGTDPVNHDFAITDFKALYCPEQHKCDPATTLFIPLQNVATIDNDAMVLDGRSNAIIDKNDVLGFTHHTIGEGDITIKLPQPYLLESIKLRFSYMVDYKCFIQVSIDGEGWNEVVPERNVSMMGLTFPRQPVMFIKLVGTFSASNGAFECNGIDCPAPAAGNAFNY
uniref:BTB domain-containing protein n=1 Tax=Panagrellus redivivus TaxID=6233 RepID=A0A7E4US97_PANRE